MLQPQTDLDQSVSQDLAILERLMTAAAERGRDWAQRRDELLVDEKSAGQFASNADLEIEHLLRDGLAAAFPDDAIIGEELGGALGAETTGWAIDPIDGTSNFVLGLPIWGISVGFVDQGRSVRGAIALPALNLIVSAADGHGVRINGAPATDLTPKSPVTILAVGENDYETGSQTDARAQVFRDAGYSVVRYRCAVFALAMSALGRLSGYVEHGCGLWDLAAGDVICREAGLHVRSQQITPDRWEIDARWAI